MFSFSFSRSSSDEDNCQKTVEELQCKFLNDKFLFRPFIRDKQSLLFIHQIADQRHILKRHGDELCCSDVTYKTSKFAVQIFFIVVKTNPDYQVCVRFTHMLKQIMLPAIRLTFHHMIWFYWVRYLGCHETWLGLILTDRHVHF